MKKLVGQNSHTLLSGTPVKLHKSQDVLSPEAKACKNKLDSFEIKYTQKNLNPELFLKINKAMRQEVLLDVNSNDNAAEFGQNLTREDLKIIKSLSQKQLEHAYLEGIYVAERYCALVDPGDNAVKANAQNYMAEYMKYIKQHGRNQKELYWIKRDYEAGTAGEDVESDAALIKRADKFYKRLQKLDLNSRDEQIHKQTMKVLNKDINPLAAFIALRRALFLTK